MPALAASGGGPEADAAASTCAALLQRVASVARGRRCRPRRACIKRSDGSGADGGADDADWDGCDAGSSCSCSDGSSINGRGIDGSRIGCDTYGNPAYAGAASALGPATTAPSHATAGIERRPRRRRGRRGARRSDPCVARRVGPPSADGAADGGDACVADHDVLDSIVKVYAVTASPHYFLPWTIKLQAERTGSGFAIGGGRLLTNAHVVANATCTFVRKHGGTVRYPARIEHIGHECDLALLSVDDDEFWVDLPALSFGQVPNLQDIITTIGFPLGGDAISLSRGVVSRIDYLHYSHGALSLPVLQIDAAINPGNSGGPAMRGTEVIGVAFQSLAGAENISYVIPSTLCRRFLDDIQRHGRYTGFCQLGCDVQTLENAQHRAWLGMPRGMSGVLVRRRLPLHHAAQALHHNDVITAIDGQSVANDGTIVLRNRERIYLEHRLSEKFVGDMATLRVFRDAQLHEVALRLDYVPPLVPAHQYDRPPSYFVYAGLVFVPLTQPYLHEWGDDWFNTAPRKLVDVALNGIRTKPGEQVVVLSQILVDVVNAGYSAANMRVLAVNSTPISNLGELIEAVLRRDGENVYFQLEDNFTIVLRRDLAGEATERVLRVHHIPRAASADYAHLLSDP